MCRTTRPFIRAAMLAVLVLSCREAPPEASELPRVDSATSTEPVNLPLRDIMRGLEIDLAGIAHGIWIGDPEVVRTAANRIAAHPGVTSAEMAVIQAVLGSEFPVFVQHDRAVHDVAVELAEAVDSSGAPLQLFGLYVRLQEGCMSCHTGFQARVSEALVNATGRV